MFKGRVGKPFTGKITIQWLKFLFHLCQFGRSNLGTRSGLHFIILSGTTASLLPESPSQASSSISPSSSTMPPWLSLISVQLTPDIKMAINRHRYSTDINMSMPYIVSVCGFVILGLLILPTTFHVLCLLLLLS